MKGFPWPGSSVQAGCGVADIPHTAAVGIRISDGAAPFAVAGLQLPDLAHPLARSRVQGRIPDDSARQRQPEHPARLSLSGPGALTYQEDTPLDRAGMRLPRRFRAIWRKSKAPAAPAPLIGLRESGRHALSLGPPPPRPCMRPAGKGIRHVKAPTAALPQARTGLGLSPPAQRIRTRPAAKGR